MNSSNETIGSHMMRKRRTKSQLALVEEKVVELFNAGFTPHAIYEYIGERADLLNGILRRIIVKNINTKFKFDVIPAKMRISELSNNSEVRFYRYEIDEVGAILLLPIRN